MNEDLSRARQIGASYARDVGLPDADVFADRACDPARHRELLKGEIPTLHLEDVSAIPFVSVIPGVERYQHRARVRADTGDIFAAVTPISPGYEPYCRDVLGLGEPAIVMAEPVTEATAVARACHEGDAWRAIRDWAADGPVAIHPYMAIEDVWELAARLRADGVDAFVVGPNTGALWVANDKHALDDLVRRLLGDELLVATSAELDLEAICTSLRDFATRFDLVGLKRTRCASAMGNSVLDGAWLRAADDDSVRDVVSSFLDRTEWDGREEILVVEWADTDVSPSTQMWIPPYGAGDPVVEGIYEQLLEGPEKVFLGSRPSRLPDAVHERLAGASLHISAAFQAMGYVGRCSFDFIVVGDPAGEFAVRLTECNGRWGGTSTPMFLVDRLGLRDESGRRPYHAQDFVHHDLVGLEFDELLRAVGDDLYDPRSDSGRFVLYNVGPLQHDGKFDVISVGRTHEEALEGVADVLPSRLGL